MARTRKYEVDQIYPTTKSGNFEIIEYISSKDITVRFLETGYITKIKSSKISSGEFKDRLRPSVEGVGYLGDGEYKASYKGKHSEHYTRWKAMLQRCYNERFLESNPHYKGCTVCPEWHNYQNFAKWFDENYPQDGKDYDLDKDIKVAGNRVYSPDTCLFVTPIENSSHYFKNLRK